jgi:cyclin B
MDFNDKLNINKNYLNLINFDSTNSNVSNFDKNTKEFSNFQNYNNYNKIPLNNFPFINYNSKITNFNSKDRFDFNEKNNFNLKTQSNKTKETYSKQINSILHNFIFQKNVIPWEIFPSLYDELIKKEMNKKPCFGYMVNQTDVNEKMRAVLIDWLAEVHSKLLLAAESLFLTVRIIDTFLSKQIVSKNDLQLLGVSSLLLACKYQDNHCPDLKDFVYITGKEYTKEQIVSMEKEILHNLKFDIVQPSIIKFFDFLAINFGFNETKYFLGKYFLELFLLDYRINKYYSSLVACAAVYLVMKIFKHDEYKVINSFTLAPEKDLKNCAKEICFLVENIDSTNLSAIKNKYAGIEFYEVSKINFK